MTQLPAAAIALRVQSLGLIAVALSFTTAVPTGANTRSAPLEVHVVLWKTELRVGEPVTGALVVKNASDKPVLFDATMVLYGHYVLIVKDARGREVPYPGRNGTHRVLDLASPKRDQFVSLPAGYVWGREILVPKGGIRFKTAGVYYVCADFTCWETGSEFGLRAWTGTIHSQSVKLTVVAERERR